MEINFTIPIIPTPQMRARSRAITKGGKSFTMTYKDPKQRRNEEQLMQIICQYAPKVPLDGCVMIYIDVYLPIPVSKPTWFWEAAMGRYIRPTGKPDADNYVKNLLDCMTQAGYWHDDSQIVCCEINKFYDEKPRWSVTVRSYEMPKSKKEYEAIYDRKNGEPTL